MEWFINDHLTFVAGRFYSPIGFYSEDGTHQHGFLYDTATKQTTLLADPSLDFPFCAMWANENWTRRWDGLEREVLIAQEYRESDDAALVAHFARLFADPRSACRAGRSG